MDEKRLYRVLGQKIRELRKENHYKQADLAEKVGLERTSITNIETGRQKVTVFILYKICSTFHIDINVLLPRPEDLIEHNIDTDNESGVSSVGSKTLAAIKNIRGN